MFKNATAPARIAPEWPYLGQALEIAAANGFILAMTLPRGRVPT
jgi:hypothetical protein